MGTSGLSVSPCQQTLVTDIHHLRPQRPSAVLWYQCWLILCAHRYHNVLTEGEADYLVQLVSTHSSQPSKRYDSCTSHGACTKT